MAGGPSWHSPDYAAQFDNHDYADFAQEFLRRNATYQADYEQTMARIADAPDNSMLEREGLAGRWGLQFPFLARS